MDESRPVLRKLREAIDEIYGSRVERVVLYGSRARGDARPESDYDVAIFLHGLANKWRDGRLIADIELDILEHDDAFVSSLLFPAGRWREQSPLMTAIREHGQDI